MKKFFYTFAILISCSTITNAQGGRNFQFSIGPEVGFPAGKFSETHSVGIGANVTAEYKFDANTSGTISSGFDVYSGKNYSTNLKYKSLTIIPFKAGVRYYFGPSFYGGAELGVGFFSGYTKGSTFNYALGLGTKIKAGSKNLDVGLKYDAYSKSGTLGAIVAKVALIL